MGIQAVSSSQVANAVPSADGARVAFVKVVGGFSQIYTMNPDGTDVEALPGQSASANNTDPASSPDGTKIAFTSNSSGNLDVWVIGLDGSGLTQLTTDPGADSAPAWSPGGATIAYQSDTGGNLNVWLMNANGSGQHHLTTNPASDSQPAWFPTGSRVAFQSNRSGNSDIWAINSNGTSLTHVTTSTAPDTQPSVGTGGGTIAFTSRRNGNTDIYTVPAAGGTNTRVTSNAAVDSQPAFSTDGRWLAFTSNRTGINQVFADPRPTGTAKQLTTDTNPASEADYSPYAYPTPLWSNRLTGSQTGGQNNFPNAIAVSPDGTKVFSAGGVFAGGLDVFGYVAAYASTGTTPLWTKTFHNVGFAGESYGGAYALAVSPDSSTVYVGGYSGNDMYVASYNATTGVPIRDTFIDSSSITGAPAASSQAIWTMAVSSDGSTLYAAGTQYGSTGFPQGSDTVSLSTSTLSQNWSAYHAKGDPLIGSMVLSPSGDTVYWAGDQYGASVSVPADNNYLTIAYQTSDGTQKFAETYNGPANSEDDGGALALSPDGSQVYVTGWSWGGSTKSDQATIAYSTTDGSTVWTRRYNSPSNGYDWGNALAVSPDGSTVYAAGGRTRTVNGKETSDYLLTALDSGTGDVNWARMYNGPGDYTKTDAGDSAYGVNVASDGSTIFVTGQSYRTGTSFDLATVAYDSSGNQVWIARYNGPNNGPEYAPASAFSPDGSTLFVTGQSKGTTYYAGATLAWDLSTVPAVVPADAGFARPSTGGPSESGAVGPAFGGASTDRVPAGLVAKRQLEALLRSR